MSFLLHPRFIAATLARLDGVVCGGVWSGGGGGNRDGVGALLVLVCFVVVLEVMMVSVVVVRDSGGCDSDNCVEHDVDTDVVNMQIRDLLSQMI